MMKKILIPFILLLTAVFSLNTFATTIKSDCNAGVLKQLPQGLTKLIKKSYSDAWSNRLTMKDSCEIDYQKHSEFTSADVKNFSFRSSKRLSCPHLMSSTKTKGKYRFKLTAAGAWEMKGC